MKQQYRNWLVLLILGTGLALAQGCDDSSTSTTPSGKDVIEREGNPDVVYYDDSDDLMNRGIAKAKATYAEFLTALEAKDPASTGFSVKKPFEAREGKEHLWISDVAWDGKKFTGTVGNEPVNVPGLALGQAVEVKPEELSDWMYILDGKLYGGYTIRVMMGEYPPEERKAIEQQMGFTVPEIDF